MPERNEPDLMDVPQEIRDELEVVFVGMMEDVLEQVLEKPADS